MSFHVLLQPYRPTAEDPFDAVKAAHLLNRAGFGGTESQIEEMVELGPQRAVEKLMSFPDQPASQQGDDVPDLSPVAEIPPTIAGVRRLQEGLSQEERQALRQRMDAANRQSRLNTIQWWLRRMVDGPHPLQERLTLFWHGHFTTNFRDGRTARLLWRQNELLRAMAAGNFADFVLLIAQDPAMIDYLNNQQNRRQRPNENFARELMELFTLGIGHYTEDDVKEAARAFTGWHHDGEKFAFRQQDHDAEVKQFMGRQGRFSGGDIIGIILQHPACATNIAVKIFRHFVRQEVDQHLGNNLGQVLRSNRYNLRPLLRTILMSRVFYSPAVIGSRITGPIELLVATTRKLGIELPPIARSMTMLGQMGQVPMDPPNVKGWPEGRDWINTTTLLARQNALLWLSGPSGPAARMNFIPEGADWSSGADAVDYWLGRLIQRPVAGPRRAVLVEALGDRHRDQRALRSMVQLILSMSEYQLA